MSTRPTDVVTTPEHRPRDRRARFGCLSAVLLAACIVVGGVVWLNHHFNPPPVRVQMSPESLHPWPAALEVVAERAIVGSPSMSIETAPPIERLYILLKGDDLESGQVSALASAHLVSLGWQMQPGATDGVVNWFDVASSGSPRGETIYVGPLVDYLDSGSWASGDGAADELRRIAGSDVDGVVVVQVVAFEE